MNKANRNKRIKVLLVSLPGMMQNVLRDTFVSRSDVDLIGVASGGLSAINLIYRRQIDLVVIDSNLPESETSELILWLKKARQNARSLVLVETSQQLTSASSAVADFKLRSYSLAESLDSVFDNLTENKGMINE